MHPRFVLFAAVVAIACSNGDASPRPLIEHTLPALLPGIEARAATARDSIATRAPAPDTVPGRRTPNELGRIPILEYHLIGDTEGRWQRERSRFRRDLELLYERGYRPVSVADLVDGRINLPAGLSPVVFTFDDASPSQFRYVEEPDGSLTIDSTSALGIWLSFASSHPGWENRATFCVLSGAEAGRSFFGNKGIEGQKTEWRFRKIRDLADLGFELCNHTLWHANLAKYDDAVVQEQIARGVMAIDSAVPGYRVRTLALPLGVWPKNRELAVRGSWRDPKGGREIAYRFDAVLEVAGYPVASPSSPAFTPLSLDRVQVFGDQLERTLDQLERTRYVSAGNGR
jgi:peptidoglycan/xylan/chitin deacetylase (PgdA/CDA1 family)